MSVLGISLAGQAANSLIFNYEKSQYEKAISKLENCVTRLDGHLSRLRELRASVPGFWDDEDAKKACQALDITISSIVENMEICKDLIQTYKNVVAEFDSSKNVVNNLIADALGILGGLGG